MPLTSDIPGAAASASAGAGSLVPHALLAGGTPRANGALNSAKRFWTFVVLVLLAEAAAIVAFYGLEWTWLRHLHVLWLQTALEALGCQVQTAGTLLTVEGRYFRIDPDCTYVDLIVCSLPLLWRFRRRFSANLAVLAAFAVGVLVGNLGRVLFGVYAFAHGVSLFWAHDLVDYVLWYPTMAVVAWLWLRSLRTSWPDGAQAFEDAESAERAVQPGEVGTTGSSSKGSEVPVLTNQEAGA